MHAALECVRGSPMQVHISSLACKPLVSSDMCVSPVTLQIFTKPLSDRPTIFIEIIERRGCLRESKPSATNGTADRSLPADTNGSAANGTHGSAEVLPERFSDIVAVKEDGTIVEQAAGCGGFGKGNFSELFKVGTFDIASLHVYHM